MTPVPVTPATRDGWMQRALHVAPRAPVALLHLVCAALANPKATSDGLLLLADAIVEAAGEARLSDRTALASDLLALADLPRRLAPLCAQTWIGCDGAAGDDWTVFAALPPAVPQESTLKTLNPGWREKFRRWFADAQASPAQPLSTGRPVTTAHIFELIAGAAQHVPPARPVLLAQEIELLSRFQRFHQSEPLAPGMLVVEKQGLGAFRSDVRAGIVMIVWRMLDPEDRQDQFLVRNSQGKYHGLDRLDCMIAYTTESGGLLVFEPRALAQLTRYIPGEDGQTAGETGLPGAETGDAP